VTHQRGPIRLGSTTIRFFSSRKAKIYSHRRRGARRLERKRRSSFDPPSFVSSSKLHPIAIRTWSSDGVMFFRYLSDAKEVAVVLLRRIRNPSRIAVAETTATEAFHRDSRRTERAAHRVFGRRRPRHSCDFPENDADPLRERGIRFLERSGIYVSLVHCETRASPAQGRRVTTAIRC
jgi:hypothetical protein